MILKLLLNSEVIWMIFTKILTNAILLVFDNMIADMLSNKNFKQQQDNCFQTWKTKHFTFFRYITLFCGTKKIFDQTLHVRISRNITNTKQLPRVAINHSSVIDFKDLIKLYEKCNQKPCSPSVNNKTLSTDDPLPFRSFMFYSSYR